MNFLIACPSSLSFAYHVPYSAECVSSDLLTLSSTTFPLECSKEKSLYTVGATLKKLFSLFLALSLLPCSPQTAKVLNLCALNEDHFRQFLPFEYTAEAAGVSVTTLTLVSRLFRYRNQVPTNLMLFRHSAFHLLYGLFP